MNKKWILSITNIFPLVLIVGYGSKNTNNGNYNEQKIEQTLKRIEIKPNIINNIKNIGAVSGLCDEDCHIFAVNLDCAVAKIACYERGII